MVFTCYKVKTLRDQLGLSQSAFARIVGADIRSVARWEKGASEPSGAAGEVLKAFEMSFSRNPGKKDDVVKFIANAASVGGLAFLLMSLLETIPEKTKLKGMTKRIGPHSN